MISFDIVLQLYSYSLSKLFFGFYQLFPKSIQGFIGAIFKLLQQSLKSIEENQRF